MIPHSWDAINQDTIEALISGQMPESKTIEYKLTLPGTTDSEKREFLADVTSFANAGGGDIIYGISATDGIPQEVVGLEGLDAKQLRLEGILGSSVEPRIQGLRMKPVNGFDSGSVLVIRIPQSWSPPHGIRVNNHYRFFSRHSTGKYPLDIDEIRSTVLASERITEKVQRFRDERIGRIISDETPVLLKHGSRLTLHVISVPMLASSSQINLSSFTGGAQLQPMGNSGWNNRFNVDGYVTYTGDSATSPSGAYTQVFRNGTIEAVVSGIVMTDGQGRRILSVDTCETYIVKALHDYLPRLSQLEIQAPLIIMISLTGVRDAILTYGIRFFSDSHYEISRDSLLLPDIIIDETGDLTNENLIARKMRPAFDVLWNAGGVAGSQCFDAQGDWNPGR
jgi:hypothetical protein